MKKYLVLLLAVVGLYGCTVAKVKRESAALDLNYQPAAEKARKNGKKLIMVRPLINLSFAGEDIPNSASEMAFNFRSAYGAHSAELKRALSQSIVTLLINKGFTLIGPVNSYDDITYTDKKEAYLIVAPEINYVVHNANTRLGCGVSKCAHEGNIKIGGEMFIKFREPLTGETMLTKRVDFNSFEIVGSYVKEWQSLGQGDLVTLAMAAATAPKELHDSTGKVVAETLSAFFGKTMARLEKVIDTREILSFERDIRDLKSRKRF